MSEELCQSHGTRLVELTDPRSYSVGPHYLHLKGLIHSGYRGASNNERSRLFRCPYISPHHHCVDGIPSHVLLEKLRLAPPHIPRKNWYPPVTSIAQL